VRKNQKIKSMLPDFENNKNPTAMLAQMIAKRCVSLGIQYTVISPGSRNAPLIKAFAKIESMNCLSIPDERSAGYVALGIAQQLNKPVAIICTSGTAALNFGPAMAEAYYSHIPILALTADRPPEWIDQMDGQTIRQNGLFKNFTEYSDTLSIISGKEEFWFNTNKINKSFRYLQKGPVHLNVPFRYPLYDASDLIDISEFSADHIVPETTLSDNDIQKLANDFNKSKKVLIIPGRQNPSEELNLLLDKISKLDHVSIFKHHLDNLIIPEAFHFQDRMLHVLTHEEQKKFQPDLLISFGGPVLSKKVKTFLRNNPPKKHWRIDENHDFPDTFQMLTHTIDTKPANFFNKLLPYLKNANSSYKSKWDKISETAEKHHQTFMSSTSWSDLQAFSLIMKNLRADSVLHLGNSSPVRYAQLFPLDSSIVCYGNRGTSGIDGCLSTAVGASIAIPQKTHTIILGDISFLYDSNALWNRYLQQNLKIIVINNQGGNIFRLIPGPQKTGLLEDYFEAHVPASIEKIAKAHHINYIRAKNKDELIEKLEQLYASNSVTVLEVETDAKKSAKVWADYFNNLKDKLNE
jgi:2-succinyl-5-enolpyruvyl-6-hydroxy-3-cyclohexene-1-carboxylate synthase